MNNDINGNVLHPESKKKPKKTANPSAKSTGKSDNPYKRKFSGNIKGHQVTLQTAVGSFLWKGREASQGKPFILGAGVFLQRVNNLDSARSDDPWAQQVYEEIVKAIDNCNDEFDTVEEELKEQFPDTEGIQYVMPDLTDVLEPNHYELKYMSNIGWRFTELLVRADDIILDLMVAERLGVTSAKERRNLVSYVQRRTRHVMANITQWKYTGVTRQDVEEGTELAKKAESMLGPLRKPVSSDTENTEIKAKKWARKETLIQRLVRLIKG